MLALLPVHTPPPRPAPEGPAVVKPERTDGVIPGGARGTSGGDARDRA
jgi:hypothetical protein